LGEYRFSAALAQDFRERDGKGEQRQSSGGEEANELADVTWEPSPLLASGAEEGGDSRGEGRGSRLMLECVWRR
jgi:hypothetical protein